MNNITLKRFSDPSQMLSFPSSLSFRVFLLEAPLSILGQVTGGIAQSMAIAELNGFHTGVGFQSTNKSMPYEFVFDYGVSAGFTFSALLPSVTPDGNVEWNGFSEVDLATGIDRSYWTYSTYISTVSSYQVTLIQEWILQQWIPQNPSYSLFSIVGPGVSAPVRASRCENFCFALFDFMRVSGMCIDYITVPNISVASFVTGGPSTAVKVDFNESRSDIILFYTNFAKYLSELAIVAYGIFAAIVEASNDLKHLDAHLRRLQTEFIAVVTLLADFSSRFPYIYYYGYYENNPSMGYYKITSPRIYINYEQSTLQRSYYAWNIYGEPYYADVAVGETPCGIEYESNSSVVIWVILAIIFIIFLMVIIYNLYLFTLPKMKGKYKEIE